MSSTSQNSEDETQQRSEIREELSSMTFEEMLKLKEELGTKVYKEAVLGMSTKKLTKSRSSELKRLNKNRPRELPTNRQVPFLGAEFRVSRKSEQQIRDPRFDEKSGSYDAKNFKQNYKFLAQIREKEVAELRKELGKTNDADKRKEIKQTLQKLINKNVEERKWHLQQDVLKQEQQEMRKARADGHQPHYATKKERRAKELVMKFELLKKSGKLNKHLEKRRKKNAAKDRKKLNFD